MPHVRLSAFLPRNANSGADAQHGRIITCLGLGGKGLVSFCRVPLAHAESMRAVNVLCSKQHEANRSDSGQLRKPTTVYYYHSDQRGP